jgi:hypothetical protein
MEYWLPDWWSEKIHGSVCQPVVQSVLGPSYNFEISRITSQK